MPARRIFYALMLAVAFPGFGVAADSSPAKIVEDIGNQEERAADGDRIPPVSLVADIRLGVYPGWSLSISPDGSGVIGYGSSAFDFVSGPAGTFDFGEIHESLATQVRPDLGNMRESFTVVFRQQDVTVSDALYTDNADLVLELFKTAKQNCVLPGKARIDELWERQPPSLEQDD